MKFRKALHRSGLFMAGFQDFQGEADRGAVAGRVKRDWHPYLHVFALALSGLVLLPLISLGFVALTGSGNDWPHLAANVLPAASRTTLVLLILVAAATTVIGVASAWLVVAFDFPFRRVLSWALVLP
ncbi:MAG TPA: hypothetical protein VFP43_23700, partial [Mesorhizobium sp.]|nr:hypothetical protein [Mesorhizobium sp.]